MKLWARQLALGLLLTAAIPASAVRAADGAEQVLLDKADYWRLKDRPDLARDSLDKLLALNPGQPDALYAYGILELQQGNIAEARDFLARLQKSTPRDTRVAGLQAAIQAGPVDTAALGEARRLGQSGEFPDAVRKYRESFKGPAPATYGVEYYLTLGATPAGRDEAQRALEDMARTAPGDAGIKLALARVSTYSETTRASGIASLAQLSNDPAVGPAAVRAWHQALLWLGGTREARDLYRDYLAHFPEDTEIRQHLDEQPPDTEVADKGPSIDYQAYIALQQGSLPGAEQQFAAALRLHADDTDALAGLGMVRLRQGRFTDARDLLGRAIKGAPARQPEWATAYDTATFWSGVQEAKALIASGNAQRARTLLTGLLAQKRPDNWNAELLLAEAATKLRDRPGAEQAYRRALAGKPQNSDAIVGLANLLTEEGKADEAATLASRLSPAERARIGGTSNGAADTLRTAAKDAAARGDPNTARDKFQQAIASDPKNPWARLDYARFLAGHGSAAQSFAAMDPTQTGSTPASLQAAAIFDDEQHRPADALAKLDRIPATARTPEIARFRSDVLAAGTIERAKMMANAGKSADARKVLAALFDDPEVKPSDRANIPHVLATLGDKDGAARLYRKAAAQGGPEGAKAAIGYAWMLMNDGDEAQASAVAGQIDASGGAELQKLKMALAVRKADALRRKGDASGAVSALTPLLAANPNDLGLLLAVGRAYGESGERAEAMRYYEAAYRRNPGNADALAALIDGAVQARDTAAARRYLGEAMTAHPNNARFYYLQAQIARSEGDNQAALRALETARSLNGQRPEAAGEGSSSPGSGSSTPPVAVPNSAGSDAVPASPVPMMKSADSDDLVAAPPAARVQVASLPADPAVSDTDAAPAAEGTANPRQQVAQLELTIPGPVGGYQPPLSSDNGPVPAQDSLQLDIERSMAQIESESSPMVEGGIVYRGREGTDGLSSLSEIGLPMEGSFSPWLTGTMTVNVTPLWLDAGSLSTSSLPQFGANQLLAANSLTQISPGEQSAFGVLTSLGYAYGPLAARSASRPGASRSPTSSATWRTSRNSWRPAELRIEGVAPAGHRQPAVLCRYAGVAHDGECGHRRRLRHQPAPGAESPRAACAARSSTTTTTSAPTASSADRFSMEPTCRRTARSRRRRRLFPALPDGDGCGAGRGQRDLFRLRQEPVVLQLWPGRLFQPAEFREPVLPGRVPGADRPVELSRRGGPRRAALQHAFERVLPEQPECATGAGQSRYGQYVLPRHLDDRPRRRYPRPGRICDRQGHGGGHVGPVRQRPLVQRGHRQALHPQDLLGHGTDDGDLPRNANDQGRVAGTRNNRGGLVAAGNRIFTNFDGYGRARRRLPRVFAGVGQSMKLAMAGLVVLMIGDSHLAAKDFLLSSLHTAIEDQGASVHSFGVCGSSPHDWVAQTDAAVRPRPAPQHGRGRDRQDRQGQGLVARRAVAAAITPICWSSNSATTWPGTASLPELPKDWITQQVQSAADAGARRPHVPCVWVGPPWGTEGGPSNKTFARVKDLSDFLSRQVAPCHYVNSLDFSQPGALADL